MDPVPVSESLLESLADVVTNIDASQIVQFSGPHGHSEIFHRLFYLIRVHSVGDQIYESD